MILVQEVLHAENRKKCKEGTHKSSENLEPKQYFIKNEAFPIEVSNNRYKLLPDPQVLKKEREKQPAQWPISAPLIRQFHYIL